MRARAPLLALCLGLLVSIATLAPIGPARGLIPTASAHAFLLRSDPAADAVARTPPSEVRMWFSEDLNALTSHAAVIDTLNRQVDDHDSHVNAGNAREMDVSLPLLRAGTYVVYWRAQSATDGHITKGSFIFRVARPDGSVPPLPKQLPTGNVPGAGGNSNPNSVALDGPTWLQAIATWLALVFMTFWAGGVIWETWILPPVGEARAELRAAGREAARRFVRLAIWALGLLLAADVLIVLGLAAELAGDWSGMFSPPLLGAVLFHSKYGAFWWMRQVVAGAALAMAALELRGAPYAVPHQQGEDARWHKDAVPEPARLADWPHWVVAMGRAAPGAIARGWRMRSSWGRAQLVLAAALLVAFALSGHAAAVPANELAYALAVDLLHLAGTAAWAGGLFYIACVLVPSLTRLPERQRVAVLARGLPHFSALAILTVVVLAATGSLNATIHLTSPMQFLTTTYGRTLAVKIELVLVMAGVSWYHAFRLRPRLNQTLESDEPRAAASGAVAAVEQRSAVRMRRALSQPVAAASSGSMSVTTERRAGRPHHDATANGAGATAPSNGTGHGEPAADTNGRGLAAGPGSGAPLSAQASRLATALEDWLRREAVIGVAVLLCVALLSAFAGSLVPPAPAVPAGASAASQGPYVSAPQTAAGLRVVLKVDPAQFGTNTFTVTLTDASGKPVDGAGVAIATQMLDMDMGIQTSQLKPAGQPGVYNGQADLTMAGHWEIIVRVLPPNSQQFQTFQFRLTAANTG